MFISDISVDNLLDLRYTVDVMPTLIYHYVVVKHMQHVQYGTAAPSVFCAAGDVGMHFVICIGWTGFSLEHGPTATCSSVWINCKPPEL